MPLRPPRARRRRSNPAPFAHRTPPRALRDQPAFRRSRPPSKKTTDAAARRRRQLTLLARPPSLNSKPKKHSLVVLVAALAALASPALAAMNTDRTLPTAGATCVAQFDALLKKHYAADAKCAKLIKGMLSTADPAKCPDADSAPGSAVQKCMGASEETSKAWEDFVKKCEVMNVANVSGFVSGVLRSAPRRRRRAHR